MHYLAKVSLLLFWCGTKGNGHLGKKVDIAGIGTFGSNVGTEGNEGMVTLDRGEVVVKVDTGQQTVSIKALHT